MLVMHDVWYKNELCLQLNVTQMNKWGMSHMKHYLLIFSHFCFFLSIFHTFLFVVYSSGCSLFARKNKWLVTLAINIIIIMLCFFHLIHSLIQRRVFAKDTKHTCTLTLLVSKVRTNFGWEKVLEARFHTQHYIGLYWNTNIFQWHRLIHLKERKSSLHGKFSFRQI
jgi:hypothetical protein